MRSIPDILKNSKTIAVVGLSNRPERASHAVAAYLQRQGYRILGVNPAYAGQQILGQPVYATLAQAAALDGPIDIVDCFRTPDAMVPLAREAIGAGARCLWMQLGVVNQEAANLAAAAGLDVVMDRCMKIEHAHSGGKA
ncbi:CoA-binding protein [Massilia scottii]|uniref:CoA-binding protein n=1 Tax=Massilia scottii TaxID=3057166 RepID=UPI0027966CD0|nr:CoA-binding protein [Massilia sp. CCM 9029]MDQ1830009.1 CoA-binding protein [Massilia sp. CCM 9029]